MHWDGSTRFPLRLEAMPVNTQWKRQHCWMQQRLYTQCATMLCKKYMGFMTFRTAQTIVSYSTRHSTKPTTTTRHGHVVKYAVSSCTSQHTDTLCTVGSIAEEKGKHVTKKFMPQMSDPALLLCVKTGPLSERATCMRLRASHLPVVQPSPPLNTQLYVVPYWVTILRTLSACTDKMNSSN